MSPWVVAGSMDGEMLPEKWVSFSMVAKPEDTTSQSSWEGKVYHLQKYGEHQKFPEQGLSQP